MPLLRMISKDDLLMLWCSIHPGLCLQLWSTLAWVNRALLLLEIVSWQIVYLLFNFAKLIVIDPCIYYCCSCHDFLLCHVLLMSACLVCHERLCSECIELTNMPTCYLFLPCPVFLPSLKSVMKLAMFTWVPSFLMVLFGLWPVRDFWSMLWV